MINPFLPRFRVIEHPEQFAVGDYLNPEKPLFEHFVPKDFPDAERRAKTAAADMNAKHEASDHD